MTAAQWFDVTVLRDQHAHRWVSLAAMADDDDGAERIMGDWTMTPTAAHQLGVLLLSKAQEARDRQADERGTADAGVPW